jgi:hypothetical protein
MSLMQEMNERALELGVPFGVHLDVTTEDITIISPPSTRAAICELLAMYFSLIR